ncbi:hypothetical protein MTO96_039708, partial [Rhipicephalus appendiculatus]
GDEKESTANDVFNQDISDLLEREPGANLNTPTATAKLTAATTTRPSPRPTPSTPTPRPPTTTPTTTTPSKTTREAPRKSLLAGSLLCTLGVIDFSGTYVYPLDGLCDLITFDSLFVAGGNDLSPPFCRNQNLMSDLVADPTTKQTLDGMWSQRIHHYGQVNTPVMQASGNPLEYVTQSARGLQVGAAFELG